MELIWYGPVWGQSGMEQVTRQLLGALDQLGVQIELRPDTHWNAERVGLPPMLLRRLARMTTQRVTPYAPHVICQLPKGQPIAPDAPTLCYTLFETDRCPGPWVHALRSMDRVLVFSDFNRMAWGQTGLEADRVGALPPAVDSFVYTPDGPRVTITNAKGFVLLLSGDYTERKNFEAVIEAYVKEFHAAEPVTLVIKAHYGGFAKRHRRDVRDRIATVAARFARAGDVPRILFWGDKVSDWTMAALYRSVDAFVLTSRGEGLGLQYLEAMASGVPVIAADWGAQADYLDATNALLVKSSLKVIDDPNYILKCPQALNSQWCHVSIDDLRDALRSVVTRYPEAQAKAQRARAWVRGQTWHRAAVAFIREVLTMYDGRRPAPVAEPALAEVAG